MADSQGTLLGMIYRYFEEHAVWPSDAYIEPRFEDATGSELGPTLDGLPTGLVDWNPRSSNPQLSLSIRGLASCPLEGAATDVAFFLRAVQWLAERQRAYQPPAGDQPHALVVSRTELRVALLVGGVGPGDGHMARMFRLIETDSHIWSALSGPPEGEWELTISRRIRRYRGVDSLQKYLQCLDGGRSPTSAVASTDDDRVRAMSSDQAAPLVGPLYVRLLAEAVELQGETPIQPVPRHSESLFSSWCAREDVERGALLAALTELESRGLMTLLKVMGPWRWQVTYAGLETGAALQRGSTETATSDSPTLARAADTRRVFVIHGRDEVARKAMFEFLRAIDLVPLEWSELVAATGEGSPYIGQVLDAAFATAQAVLVLLTPDDVGRLGKREQKRSDPDHERNLTPQPRLNVVFEAGMAMAHAPKRTILVELGRLRPYSDLAGRHAVRLDNSPERKHDLAERLSTAGCPVQTIGRRDWLSVTFPEDYPEEN